MGRAYEPFLPAALPVPKAPRGSPSRSSSPGVDAEALRPALAQLEPWAAHWPIQLAGTLSAPRARTLVVRLTLYGTPRRPRSSSPSIIRRPKRLSIIPSKCGRVVGLATSVRRKASMRPFTFFLPASRNGR